MIFNRALEQALRGTPGVVTAAFPKTTERYRGGLFRGIKSLRAAAFPEGLEQLRVAALRGEAEACMSLFGWSGLAAVRLPSTLKIVGEHTF